MKNQSGSCSPEQLLALQKVFDLTWMELRFGESTNYNGPSDPDALREEIARRVIAEHHENEVHSDDIVWRVLASFGFQTAVFQPQPAGSNGIAKPRNSTR
jgi:hypothetical protein